MIKGTVESLGGLRMATFGGGFMLVNDDELEQAEAIRLMKGVADGSITAEWGALMLRPWLFSDEEEVAYCAANDDYRAAREAARQIDSGTLTPQQARAVEVRGRTSAVLAEAIRQNAEEKRVERSAERGRRKKPVAQPRRGDRLTAGRKASRGRAAS